ncbi:glycoside hydrolase family 35 protein [Apiospora saccharicola]
MRVRRGLPDYVGEATIQRPGECHERPATSDVDGLKAVLRPGPYVCAERDWGGLPGWVSQLSGVQIRSNNAPFLNATSKYMAQVGAQDWVVSNGNHISIFMFHGGTSWGFGNGAADAKPVQAFTTSYDYGAPLDETGRPAQIYSAFRNVIAKRVAGIPAVPSTPPLMTVSDFALTPVLGMFDGLASASPRTASSPLVMEATGQVFGYMLYEYVATGSASGAVTPGTGGPRDRVVVYVNGGRRGVIDGIYRSPAGVSVTLARGDKLWLLVENLGRADNGRSDQTKGILGDVSVGGTRLSGGTWNHYNFPLDTAPAVPTGGGAKTVAANGPPVWYRGTFTTTNSGMAADTFLQLPGGVKGVVFVNGHNLGRYWTVGPQQELFLPGAYLKQGEENVVLVLELEPGTSSRVARGVAKRTWKNNPDPDCNNCS